MSTGGMLYLVMVVVAACAFAAVLAYYSHVQSKLDRAKAARQAVSPPQQVPARVAVHA